MLIQAPQYQEKQMSETPVSLLERLRQQPDEESWKELLSLYQPWLSQWLNRFSLQDEDKEDLIQEVLHAVVRDLPNFEHNQRKGAFRLWLRRILTHRLKEFWRSRQTLPLATGKSNVQQLLHQLEDPQSNLSDLFDREHDKFVAQRLLIMVKEEFRPETWRAFQQTVLEDRKPAEVAEALQISVNAVLISKSRILKRLRELGKGIIDPD